MNAQEIFSKITTHLLKQNGQSIDENCMCRYRGPNGLMCAIGCLLVDLPAEDVARVEAKRIPDPDVQALLIRAGAITQQGEYNGLLDDLQRTHDSCPVGEWPSRLKVLAGVYNLEMP